jgi:type IV pilus assembly protein PilO
MIDTIKDLFNDFVNNLPKNQKVDEIKELLMEETTRMYILAGVAGVIIALFLSFAVIPKFTELARSARTVNDLNDKIDLVTSRVKKLNQTTKKLEALKADQKVFSEQMPPEKDIPELLEDLSEMAKSSKVKILSITPTELSVDTAVPGSEMYYKKMPIRITAKSGYHQIGAFITELEKGKRLIIIDDLSIKGDSKNAWMHDMRIGLNAYVSVEEKKK